MGQVYPSAGVYHIGLTLEEKRALADPEVGHCEPGGKVRVCADRHVGMSRAVLAQDTMVVYVDEGADWPVEIPRDAVVLGGDQTVFPGATSYPYDILVHDSSVLTYVT